MRINKGIINFILLNIVVASFIIFSKIFYPGWEVYFCFFSLFLIFTLKTIIEYVKINRNKKTNEIIKNKITKTKKNDKS